MMKKPKSDLETALIRLSVILTILGLLICLSTTMPDYFYRGIIKNPYSSFLKQLLAALIGTVLLLFARTKSAKFYKGIAIPFFVFNIFLLLVVLVIPSSIKNEFGDQVRRSIPIPYLGFTFQPSELAKVAVVLFFAKLFSSREKRIKNKEFLTWFGILLIPAVLILKEPNFSAAMLLIIIGSITMYFGGVSIVQYLKNLVPITLAGTIFILLIGQGPRIMNRFTNYLGIFTREGGDQYQLINSLRTIAQGRFFGMGFLKSTQKFQNLPFNSTDFVFSVICEEFGIIMAISILILFFLLFLTSIQISLKTRDHFSSIVAAGLGSHIFLQAFFHVGVTVGLVPPTGVPLPFVSIGGTAMMVTLFEIGILLSIVRRIEEKIVIPETTS
jgi:cell division protein FtsW